MVRSRWSPVSAQAATTGRRWQGQAAELSSPLPQLMAVLGTQCEPVENPELLDVLERLRRERRLALEGVQHDALQQIAQTHILLLRNGLQHLQHPLLESEAGLDTFHLNRPRMYRSRMRRLSFGHC